MGLGLTMNLVNVPCIKASSDPLPVFTTTYNNASKFAITNILMASLSHLYISYRTGSARALLCGALTLINIPYTLLFIKPTNDALFRLHRAGTKGNDKAILPLINKWNSRQWVRTILGTAAFLLNIDQYTR